VAKQDIRLLAFDLDGTLLTSNEQVSDPTRLAIQQLQRQGLYITLVSGRTYNSVCAIASALGLKGPLVAYNGAFEADPRNNQPDYCQPMDWKVIKPVLQMLEEEQVYTKVYINDTLYVQEKTEETTSFSKRHGVVYKETGPGGLSKLNEDPLKIVVIEGAKRIGDVYRSLAPWDPLLKIFKEEHGIEINHQNIHKATGLEKVCKSLGLAMSQVMAFGNETNDIEMIREAGIGVAMGNAIQSLQDEADFISKSNDEDGIIYALKQYGLL
jgi:Cof subfamily protein (haloacid dehalogenase superfamily)